MSLALHENYGSNFATITHEEPTAEEAYISLYNAISHADPEAALELLEHLTTEDVIWRLSGENDTLQALESSLSDTEVVELKESIVNDAIILAVHRLPAEVISGVGLDPKHYDDAGISYPPSITDALLLAKSWDNTDHDETLGSLLAVMLDELPDGISETPKQALQVALEEGVAFADAHRNIIADIDRRLDYQPHIVKKQATSEEEPLEGPGMEHYEWLWDQTKLKPGEQRLVNRNNRIADFALRRSNNRLIAFLLAHQR